MVGHAGQMGMALEVAHQVVENKHLAVGGHRLLVDGGGHYVGGTFIAMVTQPTVIIEAILIGVVPRLVYAGVEETGVVITSDVRVLHTFISIGVVFVGCTSGQSAGGHHRAVAHLHLIGNHLDSLVFNRHRVNGVSPYACSCYRQPEGNC